MHKRRAHPDQELSSTSIEINNNIENRDSTSDKPNDECEISHENSTSIGALDIPIVNTPAAIMIADMDLDDVPIRFCVGLSMLFL